MKNKGRLTISRTKRASDFKLCARLMEATDPWVTLGLNYRTCLKAVSAPLREVYAARRDGAALGFIVLRLTGTFNGYIQTICVAPEARGLGIGTRMIRFAERRIFKESPNVFMCVSSFNRKARKLYQKLGYVKTGVLRDFVVKGYDELLLRKTRGPLRAAGRNHG